MAQATTGGFSVTGLLQNVDNIGHTYVQSTYQSLVNNLDSQGLGGSVATLMLTLYLVLWGYSIWAGTAQGSPTEICWRLFRVFIIYTMALKWAEFQTLAYNFINDAPESIGRAMLSASSTGYSSTGDVQNGLQQVIDITNDAAEKFVKNAGVLSWGVYIYAGTFQLVMYALVGIAIAAIVLAKVMTWILLATAPIFILLMLFAFTARYTIGWINAIILFFVVQIIIYAFLAFYLSLITGVLNALAAKASTVTVVWGDILPVELMGVIGIFLMIQIPAVAGMIVGTGGFHWPVLGRFLSLGGGFRKGRDRRPQAPALAGYPPSIGPNSPGGPGLISPSPAPPVLSPPAKQLSPPPLLLPPPAHYSAEAQRLAKQLKNNS